MKKLLQKKRKGSIEDILGTSICLLALMIVFLSFVHFCTIIEFKRQLNYTARNYLLKVETSGKLTDEELSEFETDVTNLCPKPGVGTYTVSVNYNCSNQPVQYREDVSVSAHVYASYDALGLTKIYDTFHQESSIRDLYEFEVSYHSTSKQ